MIINESEIRQIIRNEIIKKAKRAHAKRITENALSKIRESKNKYSTEIISEVYGDPSYSGTPVAYGSSNPYETGGSQQARPSTSLGPLAGAPAAAPAPAPARRSGLRYSASDTFPIKKGDKDPSGSNRIKKLQAKIGTKADGFYGPKSAAKVKQLHGVEVVSEELYNEIMGLGGRVDVTTGPTGGDQRLGTGGAPRQVTRQTSGGTYRIKKKKKGTIKIDPVRGMEKTIKNAVVKFLNKEDPANRAQHGKVKVGRILVDLRNPNVDDFGEEDFMSASVRLKGDLGRLAAVGRGKEASNLIKQAIWSALKSAGVLEV